MRDFETRLQQIIDQKTKPPGSLGKLESLALQIGSVQQSFRPQLLRPTILVFAGDHGAASAGVSSYPQEVTHQMVLNFLAGGACINAFCRQNAIELKVIDAGVNHDFASHPGLIDAKVARATRNYLHEPAMSESELDACFEHGEAIVDALAREGCNTVGFGEMGIGNSASASLLMSAICDLPLADCVGRGAGADDRQLHKKLALLGQAQARHGVRLGPKGLLQTYGGFEMTQMTAAMLAAYRHNFLLLIDGFISTSSYLLAAELEPGIADNAIFCHQSQEQGHGAMQRYLGASPLLDVGMRLGEGTGCALALPLIQCAVAFLNEMASFDSASISGKV